MPRSNPSPSQTPLQAQPSTTPSTAQHQRRHPPNTRGPSLFRPRRPSRPSPSPSATPTAPSPQPNTPSPHLQLRLPFPCPAGTYSTAQSVQISDATPGATIYYTTNGAPQPPRPPYTNRQSASRPPGTSRPSPSPMDTPPAHSHSSLQHRSRRHRNASSFAAPGAYGKSQSVTITDATAGAVITYSVGIGSVVNTYTYTGPFTVSSTEYIAYDAIAPGYTRSAALEGIYTIGTVPTPQFSPAAGTYSTAQAVNIYDITPGATIYYTTDGTTPTTASAVYTVPIIVTANQTIRAFAAVSGLTSSASNLCRLHHRQGGSNAHVLAGPRLLYLRTVCSHL
jgi:hypothetical protein